MEINLNSRLKELRNNIPQKSISKKLGIPYANYNKYETTNVMPDLKTLCKMADYYNVSLDYLVGREFGNELGYLTPNQFSSIKLFLNLNELNQMKVNGYMLGLLENQ